MEGLALDEIGVIHGRFQMLHKGHMEYLIEGKKRCKRLVIGICNPDNTLMKYDESCPHRATSISNPLTYFERYEMIKGSMLDAGIREFDIVPFPINYPELIFNYAPQNAKYYITIYDQWGEQKKKLLMGIGCDVEVMWSRTDADRFTSGTEVRSRIMEGKDWRNLVPDYVYTYTLEHGIDKRIITSKGL